MVIAVVVASVSLCDLRKCACYQDRSDPDVIEAGFLGTGLNADKFWLLTHPFESLFVSVFSFIVVHSYTAKLANVASVDK